MKSYCCILQIWLMAAKFEIRQHRLDAARKILGMALGLCPKDKTFNSYITLELQLGQFERCRQLYAKYLEWRPENCRAWCKWVELEQSLGEEERCRAMYELAIQMPVLDMPEVLWKVEFPLSPSTCQYQLQIRIYHCSMHCSACVAFNLILSYLMFHSRSLLTLGKLFTTYCLVFYSSACLKSPAGLPLGSNNWHLQ